MGTIKGMNKLRRQIIMLALCLTAVLIARFYVNDFLKTQRNAAQNGADAASSTAASAPLEPETPAAAGGSASGITVETGAVPAHAAGDTATSAPPPSPMASGAGGR